MAEKLEQSIRRIALDRCEYCLMPEAASGLKHVLDHIRARQHDGKTEFENLALCCGRCNAFKGPNSAGIDPRSQQVTPLFHPRQNTWSEHFRYDGAVLIGLTATGRATIAVLSINLPIRIASRHALMAAGLFDTSTDSPKP
jgi:hypothetical protein